MRDLSDEDAYMALALCNAQGELSPLEIGIHALGSGMQPKEYADKIGKSRTSLQHNYNAARVALETNIGLSDLDRHWLALDALHSSARWLWRSLVSRLVSEGWTVEQARGAAQRFKDAAEPPPKTAASLAGTYGIGEVEIGRHGARGLPASRR